MIIKKIKSKFTPRPRDSKIMKYENAKSLNAIIFNAKLFGIKHNKKAHINFILTPE